LIDKFWIELEANIDDGDETSIVVSGSNHNVNLTPLEENIFALFHLKRSFHGHRLTF